MLSIPPSQTGLRRQFTSRWHPHPTARNFSGVMMNKHELSRRQFLRTASMASMAGLTVSPFLLELNSLAAMAQQSGASDYKALVCIFLQGGNDGHGTVIATDTTSFSAFTQARSGAPGLAYSQS